MEFHLTSYTHVFTPRICQLITPSGVDEKCTLWSALCVKIVERKYNKNLNSSVEVS